MMRAAFYGRYSSHAQKDTSIEQQLRECREWARRNDVQIVAEYADRALTGTTDKREQFQKMIRDSAKGKWQIVLCYKVDRFARNRYDSATYKARLKKNGVRVVYPRASSLSLFWKVPPSITARTCRRTFGADCVRTRSSVK